jgi:hypothetical protein
MVARNDPIVRRGRHAGQCVDPFRLVKVRQRGDRKDRRWAWNLHRDFGLVPRGGSNAPAGRCSKTRPPQGTLSSPCSTNYAATARCSTAAGNPKKASVTSTASPFSDSPSVESEGCYSFADVQDRDDCDRAPRGRPARMLARPDCSRARDLRSAGYHRPDEDGYAQSSSGVCLGPDRLSRIVRQEHVGKRNVGRRSALHRPAGRRPSVE